MLLGTNLMVSSNSPVPVDTAQVPALSKSLDQHALARLAREIAQNIRPLPAILKDYGITEEQFKAHVDPIPLFKRMLEQALIEWNSTGSTLTRLKLEAAVTLEDSLQMIGARMVKADEDLGKVVEAAKMLSNIAGIGKGELANGAPGEKFSIVINLGGDQKFEKTIDLQQVQSQPEGAGENAPLPELAGEKGS